MPLARIWFDRPGVRWRVVLALSAAATLLIGLWIAERRGLWSAPEEPEAAVPAPAVPVAPPAPPRRLAAAGRASAPAVAASVPPAPAEASRDELSPLAACGLAGPAPVADTAAEPGTLGRERRERWLAAMQAGADERVRAAGWLIGMAGDQDAMGDRLATLAATSLDPVVRAYAMRSCRNAPGISACLALTPDAWTRVEPDNAAAWLAMAADPRLDTARQLEALQRAAAAGRFDAHATALHALVQGSRPAGTSDLQRLAMARDIVAVRADWLSTEALRLHCSATALRAPDRAKTCEAIAELLVAQAQTLSELQQAREIGERVGWKDDRIDELRGEYGALAALQQERADAEGAADCDALAERVAYYAEVGRVGEVAALRRLRQGGR